CQQAEDDEKKSGELTKRLFARVELNVRPLHLMTRSPPEGGHTVNPVGTAADVFLSRLMPSPELSHPSPGSHLRERARPFQSRENSDTHPQECRRSARRGR